MKSILFYTIVCSVPFIHSSLLPESRGVTGATKREVGSPSEGAEQIPGRHVRSISYYAPVTVVMGPLSETSWILGGVANFIGAMNPSGLFSGTLADMLKHSAIFVDDEFYEFTEVGLVRASRGSRHAIALAERDWPQRWSNTSRMDLYDFKGWIHKNQYQFTEDNYNLKSNNCHNFVEKACKFLGVPVPDEIAKILAQCKDWRNWVWIRLIGASGSSSASGGKSMKGRSTH